MAFKFAVMSPDGEIFETFEAARPDYGVGDPVILAGNRHFTVTATIPLDRVAEFVDGAVYGVLEVEAL